MFVLDLTDWLSIAHKTESERLYDGGDDDYVLIATMVLMVLI